MLKTLKDWILLIIFYYDADFFHVIGKFRVSWLMMVVSCELLSV